MDNRTIEEVRNNEYRPLDTLEILEVLTKEMFEQMSYKVGE